MVNPSAAKSQNLCMEAVTGGIGDPGESEKGNIDTECNMHHLWLRTGEWLPHYALVHEGKGTSDGA
jgi:hypothetical protein